MTRPLTGEITDHHTSTSTAAGTERNPEDERQEEYYVDFMAQQSNFGYQFTAPYAPEQGDFQPVPISMQIAFVPVAMGPPFSIGDDIEATRRREMERTQGSQVATTFQAPAAIPAPPPPPAPPTQTTYYYPGNPPATNTYVAGPMQNSILDTVMAIMRPTAEMLAYSNTFTHIQISNQAAAVPISYIRERIPHFYRHLYLDEQTSTHSLQLHSINLQTLTMPAHDLVLTTQCLAIRNVASFQTTVPGMTKPALVIQNVPHLPSFGVLFRWLYANDQDELYEALAGARAGGGLETVFGFAQNCQFWGAIDPRITGVVRALLETN